MRKVRIFGAGFSGLTLAYELAKLGWQVDVFEKSARAGGLIQTHQTEYGPVETAASSIIATFRVQKLFNDLRLEILPAKKEAKKRFLYRQHFVKWPLTFFETLRFMGRLLPRMLADIALKKTGRSPILPQKLESLHEWGIRNLGRAAAK